MTDTATEQTPEFTLADTLIHMIGLLPVREENMVNKLVATVEKARPALEKLINEAVPVVEEAVTVAEDATKIVQGL